MMPEIKSFTLKTDLRIKETSGEEYHIPVIPSDSQRGFYFPPSASKDRAVNSMEIKDFIILWTYSQ